MLRAYIFFIYGVQLLVRSILIFFLYQILLNSPHQSCTPTKQAWSNTSTRCTGTKKNSDLVKFVMCTLVSKQRAKKAKISWVLSNVRTWKASNRGSNLLMKMCDNLIIDCQWVVTIEKPLEIPYWNILCLRRKWSICLRF